MISSLGKLKSFLSQLCDDFERTLRESISKNTITEIAEGYIYLSTDDLIAAQNIFVNYSRFAESLGFDVIDEGTFEQGSWIKKGIKMVQSFFKREEVQEIYQKGKRSLELAYIEKVQAEIDGLKVGAAAQLLESVKGTSNVAVKLGSIVLIKAEANGQEQTLIFDLTDKQRQNLEKNGFLLNQPQELLKYLNC